MSHLISTIEQRFRLSRNPMQWQRLAIVLVVLLGSFVLGRHASKMMVILAASLIAVLIFLRSPALAIFPLILGSLFVHSEIGTGTQSAINLTMILLVMLLGLWGLDMLVQQRRIYLYPSRVLPPILGLCLVAILSFISGQLPWFAFAKQVSIAAQIGGLALFLLSAGAFLWVSQVLTDLKWLRWMVWTFLGLGCFMVIGRAFNVGIFEALYVSTVTGSMFWTWMAALSASQAMFNSHLKTPLRLLLGMLAFLTVLAGWWNREWASGWIPVVIALLVILSFYNWRIGILTSLLVAIGLIFWKPDLFQQFFAVNEFSLFSRLEAWKILLTGIVRVNPLLGLGPANYYNYTPLFPILGFSVRFNSHNQYIDLIAQTGFLGLSMFLWFAFELGWLGWRLLTIFNRGPAAQGFEKAYVIGALGGLVGTMVAGLFGDWVIPFVYNIGLGGFRASVFAWFFLGGLLLIERTTKVVVPNQRDA